MADSPSVPAHIAIIPDGNRRWAKSRGLGTEAGHKAGYENLKKTADAAFDRGIKYVTAYAFSTENWSRTKEEVGYLLKLIGWVLDNEADEYHRKGIRIRVAGSRAGLDEELIQSIEHVEELTRDNIKGNVTLCFNYGGRRDIVEALNRALGSGVKSVDEDSFGNYLSTSGLPDPDLIIRTSGEERLSNFLIWEGAYSELYFSAKLWPDFDEGELDESLAEYGRRKRTFGV